MEQKRRSEFSTAQLVPDVRLYLFNTYRSQPNRQLGIGHTQPFRIPPLSLETSGSPHGGAPRYVKYIIRNIFLIIYLTYQKMTESKNDQEKQEIEVTPEMVEAPRSQSLVFTPRELQELEDLWVEWSARGDNQDLMELGGMPDFQDLAKMTIRWAQGR